MNLRYQDANQIVEKAVSIIRTNDLSERIEIEAICGPTCRLVHVDAEQIIQVILNIVLNALEAMPDGGRLILKTRRIQQRCRRRRGHLHSGYGARHQEGRHPECLQALFYHQRAGRRLGAGDLRTYRSSHGGDIRVKSIPGQGSIFISG